MANINSVLVPTGKFVTVEFITKAGEYRKYNGRTGVTKYLKHGKSTVDHTKYFVLYVRSGSKLFDSVKLVARDKITGIKASGIVAKRNNDSEYTHNV